jgi:hypothetical protein
LASQEGLSSMELGSVSGLFNYTVSEGKGKLIKHYAMNMGGEWRYKPHHS